MGRMGRGWWWWVEGTNVGNHQLTSSKNRHNRVRDRQTRRESISPPSPNSFFSMIRYYHQVGFSKHKYKHTNTNKHSLYSFCPRGSTRCCPSASASREQKKKKKETLRYFCFFFFFLLGSGKTGWVCGCAQNPPRVSQIGKDRQCGGKEETRNTSCGIPQPASPDSCGIQSRTQTKKKKETSKNRICKLAFFCFFLFGKAARYSSKRYRIFSIKCLTFVSILG